MSSYASFLLLLFVPMIGGSATSQFIGDYLKLQWKVKPQGNVHLFQCWSTVEKLWLTRDLSFKDIQSFRLESFGNNAAHLDKLDHVGYNDLIVDGSCSGTHQLLLNANASGKFTSRNRWLILLPKNHVHIEFGSYSILLDSDVVIAHKITRTQIMLEEVYKVGGKLTRKHIGSWKEDKCVYFTAPLIISPRRLNLHQITLTAITKMAEISVFDIASRVIFNHVARLLNASGRVVHPSSDANFEIWSIADINIGGEKLSDSGLNNAHYISLAMFETSTGFIFKQPSLSFMRNIFGLPFSSSVWICTLALLTVIGSLLYWAFSLETDTVHWSEIILLCLGTVCQQGSSLEVHLVPGRIVLMMLLLTAVFLYASYSACIVMLLQTPSPSIHTLDELIHSGLTLGVQESFRNHQIFSNMPNLLRAEVEGQFYPLEEGLDRMRQGELALLVDVLQAYHTISDTFEQDDKCGLQLVDLLPKGSLDHLITLKKNSEFKEILTLGYRKVHEQGLHRREILIQHFMNPECVILGASFAPVGIVDCYPLLLILLYGTLFALLILILETVKARHFVKQKIG